MPSFDAIMAGATVNEHQDELINELSTTLKLRTVVWKKTANLANALQKALWNIKNTPESVDGYLNAGILYSIQGRQYHAIQVLEKGIEIVSPDATIHTQLKNLKRIAESRLQRRIDFIAHIPYDVLRNIIGHLDARSAGSSTLVCRNWRKTLLECPEPWRVMEISRPSLTLLPTVFRHVERLSLRDETKINMKCIKLFGTNKFSNLRSLAIIDSAYNNVDMSASLYTALSHVAPTLTELRLDTPRLKTELLLGKILSTCPNLTTIQCRVSCIKDCYTSISIPHITLLTTVDLRPTRQTIAVDSLASLIRNSPHLKSLILGFCHFDILPIIGEHCPELSTIVSNIEEFEDLYNAAKPSLATTAEGLQCLSLDPVVSTRPIFSRLAKSGSSLRVLYMTPCIDGGIGATLSDWQPMSSFVMNKLTHVYIDVGDASTAFCDNMPAMLRCFPNVEMLRLQNFYEVAGVSSITEATVDGIYDAIATMKSLSHLRLVCFDIQSEAFIQLLRSHQSGKSRLRELSITGCDGMTREVLCEAAKIPSLREILVHYLPEMIPSISDVTDFAYWISRMPHLKSLDLACMELTMEATKYIASSAQLSFIWMYDVAIPEGGATLLQRHIQDVQICYST